MTENQCQESVYKSVLGYMTTFMGGVAYGSFLQHYHLLNAPSIIGGALVFGELFAVISEHEYC